MDESNHEISRYMKRVLKHYDDITGKDKTTEQFSFWDVVVISAADVNQKDAYEKQIAVKEERRELPLGVPIHVISDPPESKIGCGGSTMYALAMLTDVYGDALIQKRILFIPAGGYSQRLPSQSVLGKLFSPIPVGDRMYQMIDLIFAVYLPFLSNMAAGIFLTSSDAIISYCIEENDTWSFENAGFTALGHPSSIAVGINHGVYVLPKSKACSSFMSECLQVLQKPSEKLMREKGAIMEYFRQAGVGQKENIVYSDSVFFFDMHVIRKLVQFFKKIEPVKVEISSYGDFLQPLGRNSDKCYIQSDTSEISCIRTQLYELLHDTPLHILVLNQSAFHHLGTIDEYIENYCSEGLFAKHFSCSRFLSSTLLKVNVQPLQIKGTVLHSILHPSSIVSKTTVIEYCSFSDTVHISDNCIVSNCQLDAPSDVSKSLITVIPPDMLLHTVAVKQGFVTIFFNIHDNLKAKAEVVGELTFLNKKIKDIHGFESLIFESDISLWTAKLFPVCGSMDTSFKKAVNTISHILDDSKLCDNLNQRNNKTFYISMADILKCKDVNKMLEFRDKLYKSIKDN